MFNRFNMSTKINILFAIMLIPTIVVGISSFNSQVTVINTLGLIVSIFIYAITFVLIRTAVISPSRKMSIQVADTLRALASYADKVEISAKEIGNASTEINELIARFVTSSESQVGLADDITKLVSQITEAVGHIANGSQEQTKDVMEAHGIVKDFSDAVGRVIDNASVVARVASESLATAEDGETSASQAVSGMAKLMDTVLTSAKKMQSLGDKSKQIGEIVGVIDDIAEQTNLLALNAAIEAARAGENGKGFAVVADEVRKLAERSARATGEIADLIRGIQEEIGQAVESMEKGTEEVEAESDLTKRSGEAIAAMMESTEEVMMQIAAVRSAANQMASLSDRIVRAIDDIASITEENTALTQQVAASTEHMSSEFSDAARKSEQSLQPIQEISSIARGTNTSVSEITASMQNLAASLEELDKLTRSSAW